MVPLWYKSTELNGLLGGGGRGFQELSTIQVERWRKQKLHLSLSGFVGQAKQKDKEKRALRILAGEC